MCLANLTWLSVLGKKKKKMKVAQSCLTLQPHGLCSPWNSLGQNTGEDSLSLLQGIFPNQGLNPGLPHCRWILYQLSHKGSPLEWVAYAFSSRYSQPRNRTRVSCIAGRFFTSWAHKGSPRILEWVAYPFSSRYSQPRNRTGVSCIVGVFFTNWTIRGYCLILWHWSKLQSLSGPQLLLLQMLLICKWGT